MPPFGFVKFRGVVRGEILSRKLKERLKGLGLQQRGRFVSRYGYRSWPRDGQCCARFASDSVAIRLWVLAHGIGIWAGAIRAGSHGADFALA